MCIALLFLLCFTANNVSAQSQSFAATETAVGYTVNTWSFMTAWDLTSGGLQVSPNWINGHYFWNFSQPHYQRWTAKFIYDVSTGSSRELKWSYTQIHVQ